MRCVNVLSSVTRHKTTGFGVPQCVVQLQLKSDTILDRLVLINSEWNLTEGPAGSLEALKPSMHNSTSAQKIGSTSVRPILVVISWSTHLIRHHSLSLLLSSLISFPLCPFPPLSAWTNRHYGCLYYQTMAEEISSRLQRRSPANHVSSVLNSYGRIPNYRNDFSSHHWSNARILGSEVVLPLSRHRPTSSFLPAANWPSCRPRERSSRPPFLTFPVGS